jgi:hypothetical protein
LTRGLTVTTGAQCSASARVDQSSVTWRPRRRCEGTRASPSSPATANTARCATACRTKRSRCAISEMRGLIGIGLGLQLVGAPLAILPIER